MIQTLLSETRCEQQAVLCTETVLVTSFTVKRKMKENLNSYLFEVKIIKLFNIDYFIAFFVSLLLLCLAKLTFL